VSVIRGPQIAQVAVPTARSMRWAPLGATGLLAIVAVVLIGHTHLASGPESPGAEYRIAALRVGAVFLCLGAAFLLEDPSETVIAPAPMSALGRRAVRLGLGFLALTPVWGILATIALVGMPEPGGLPLARVSLEALTMLVLAWTAAAAAERLVPEGLGGLAAGPVLLVLLALAIAAPVLPGHFRFLPSVPREPDWGHAHVLWLRVLGAGAVLLLLFSRDPGRARLRTLARAASP
jgi:hypothetical protein